MCVTSFGNEKISKVKGICRVGRIRVTWYNTAPCNQLHDKDLIFGEHCKSAFDVFS